MFELLVLLWESFWHLLLNILVAINSVVGNAGVSIIVFTIFMRLLTVPLTMKAMRSSRNMQQIQPLIKEIQKKHANDRQKQQEEMMKLYRDYGVNPAAGCFPILVQLPIFIGLYNALDFTLKAFTGTEAEIATRSADLSRILWTPDWAQFANFNQPFLWVPSLALADPLYIWPVLSGIFQFIQSRMSFPYRDPNQPMDGQQKMMYNMMQFMPIYIVLISLGFPAGMVMYWAFSSLFGAVQQYFITGFGTLPDFPGLGWLPRKPVTQPQPLPPPTPSATAANRKGVMARMLDKALEAQEAQRAAQADETETQSTTPAAEAEADGASTVRVKRKRSEQRPRAVATDTVKYASDLKYRKSVSGNGRENGAVSATPPARLPKKKKGKR